jgi:hypothetical protein
VGDTLNTKGTQRLTLFDASSVGSRGDSTKSTTKVVKTPIARKKTIGLNPGLPKPVILNLKKSSSSLIKYNGSGAKPSLA